MKHIKKPLSLALAVVLLLGVFSVCLTSGAAPAEIQPSRKGKVLIMYTSYFSKKQNLSPAQYKQSGKKITLYRNKSISILGKEKKVAGKYYYICFSHKNEFLYGYINRENVYVENRYHYEGGTATAVNPYNGKRETHSYCMYNSMPFYQFDQTGKVGWINGLRRAYSCGAQSTAAALSALKGGIIFPEEIMKKMPRSAVNAAGKGSNVSRILPGVKDYILSKHGLSFEYKCILPNQSFDYLKKGYMVILGVENKDKLTLFTGWSHYILLVGYDNLGNVITVNSNLKTALFDSFTISRIKKNIVNSYFYNTNTIAIKCDYSDTYSKFNSIYQTTVYSKCTVSQHYGAKGRIYNLKAGKKINVLGERGNYYYIQFYAGNNKSYGYIGKAKTVEPVTVSLSSKSFVYNGAKRVPKVTLTTKQGKVLSTKYYTVTYPKSPINVGAHKITIKYNNRFRGAASASYKILPVGTTVSAVEGEGSALNVSWNAAKKPKTISTYELQYSQNSDFSNAVTLCTDSAQTTALIEDLSEQQLYYLRIRTCVTVGGKNYYSAWSKAVSAYAPAQESTQEPPAEPSTEPTI